MINYILMILVVTRVLLKELKLEVRSVEPQLDFQATFY